MVSRADSNPVKKLPFSIQNMLIKRALMWSKYLPSGLVRLGLVLAQKEWGISPEMEAGSW